MTPEPLKGKEKYVNINKVSNEPRAGVLVARMFWRPDITLAVELLKDKWAIQCEAMFGIEYTDAEDFKRFHDDFLEDINKTFEDVTSK